MKKSHLILFAVLATTLAACTSRPSQLSATTVVVDDYGRSISVPTAPRRVVSLSPAVTEIMYAIGADSLLVARTDFCFYPPAASDKPSIGGISNLSVERIVSMNPDIVISGSMVDKKHTDQFDQMGIPFVCVVEKPHFEALFDNITTIGQLTAHQAQADSLNRAIARRIDSLGVADSILCSSYYVVGFGAGGNFTAGGNTFINDILTLAGSRNIASDVEGWSYSLEMLLHKDPDYIIVRREDSASFVSMRPYNTLSAVRNGHVIGIESGMLDLQVPRNIDAILYLRQRMHTSH